MLPVNGSINQDEQTQFDPWIEIYNAGADPIILDGMHLTDDFLNPTKWQVPSGTNLCGGCFTLFWADSTPSDNPQTHTNFTLSAGGGSVALYAADGTTLIDFLNYATTIIDLVVLKGPVAVFKKGMTPDDILKGLQDELAKGEQLSG